MGSHFSPISNLNRFSKLVLYLRTQVNNISLKTGFLQWHMDLVDSKDFTSILFK